MPLRDLLDVRPRRVPLAARTLFRDWLRLVISLGGIGFAILLVLLLDGIRVGTVEKSTTYIDNVGADVVVAREGVTNMALAASTLPETTLEEVKASADVDQAAGIMRIPVIASADDEKRPVTLIGYSPEEGLGGPWKLEGGRLLRGREEAVVDSSLADELDLDIGDTLDVVGSDFEVVGFSGETANIAGKHVFLTSDAVRAGLGLGPIVSFILVQAQPGTDSGQLATALERDVGGITATAQQVLSENDRDLLSSLFAAPINVMSTVGFLVGLAIIGLTMYTTTSERMRDFGVLKAIGAGNVFLFRTVISQAVIIGLGGFAVGLLASQAAGPAIVELVPDIGVIIRPLSALQTLGAVIGMSLIGALLPVIRVTRVDPLMVFRS